MCGIVGLHLRDPSLEPRLGELLSAMLGQVVERGPDSAGVAGDGDPRLSPPGQAVVSLLGTSKTGGGAAPPGGGALDAGAPTAGHAGADQIAPAPPRAPVIG